MSRIPAEQGYDPFNPEVVRPEEQQNGKSPGSGDISGALELVNKAIEEVRSEVEREKRKLSRIGDEPYDPSESSGLSPSDASKSKATNAHMAYDPGSYQMTSGGYNPTPGCSKYTLDVDTQENKINSMEYVPSLLKKPRTHAHQLPSPPPSPKYSKSTSSSKCKYTVDISRPSTDMEYDPLSNYSAGIAVKSKRDESVHGVKSEGSKSHKLPVTLFSDEEDVAVVKKTQQLSVDTKKYTFSDSDGENSGTEYRPTTLSNLQQRKGPTGSVGDIFGNVNSDKTETLVNALTQRNKDDLTRGSYAQDNPKSKDNIEKSKVASRTSHEKSGKSEKMHKFKKTSSSKSSSCIGKDKCSVKSTTQDSAKNENKSHGKRDDVKNTVKIKTFDTVNKEEKRSDGKIKAVQKVKTESNNKYKNSENCASESNKANASGKEKEQNKCKERQHQNGKLDRKRGKSGHKISKSSSSSSGSSHIKSKGSPASSKEKRRRQEEKRRSLSLSHADLFGDESPDEAEPIVVDDTDDEVEEVLVRKSADALKRGRLNKRRASELTPSSSDNEIHHGLAGSKVGRKDDIDVGIDLSSFQDDMDFDSDPMEECLRIFNESNDVKREDKGRQIKQVLLFVSSMYY